MNIHGAENTAGWGWVKDETTSPRRYLLRKERGVSCSQHGGHQGRGIPGRDGVSKWLSDQPGKVAGDENESQRHTGEPLHNNPRG